MPARGKLFSLAQLGSLHKVLLKEMLSKDSLSRVESMAINRDLPKYIDSNFDAMFDTEGALDLMTSDIENDDESITTYDPKFGTGLPITWRPSDTVKAKECATKLRAKLRDIDEDEDTAEQITNSEWQAMIAFEFRIRCAHEKSKPAPSPAKKKTGPSQAAPAAPATPSVAGGVATDSPPAPPAASAARSALAGPNQGKKRADQEVSEEAVMNFLQKNPDRATEIAKVATNLSSANGKAAPSSVEKRSSKSSDIERLPPKTPTEKVSRDRLPSLDGKKPGSRVSLDACDDEDDEQTNSTGKGRKRQKSYRSLEADSALAEAFPKDRLGTFDGIPCNIVQMCMVSCYSKYGPFQKEDKASAVEHSEMVRDAITELFLFLMPCSDSSLTVLNRYEPLSSMRLERAASKNWRRIRIRKAKMYITITALPGLNQPAAEFTR